MLSQMTCLVWLKFLLLIYTHKYKYTHVHIDIIGTSTSSEIPIPNHLHRREASSWEVTSFLLGALLVLMATVPVVVSTVGRLGLESGVTNRQRTWVGWGRSNCKLFCWTFLGAKNAMTLDERIIRGLVMSWTLDTEAMLYKPAVPNVEDGISLEPMNATESVLLADDRHWRCWLLWCCAVLQTTAGWQRRSKPGQLRWLAESQFQRDWTFGLTLWNYLFRTMVHLQPNSYMPCHSGKARARRRSTRRSCRTFAMGSMWTSPGRRKNVHGDLTKLRRKKFLEEMLKPVGKMGWSTARAKSIWNTVAMMPCASRIHGWICVDCCLVIFASPHVRPVKMTWTGTRTAQRYRVW